MRKPKAATTLPRKDRVYLATRVQPDVKRKLAQIATRAKRTTSAEMEVALEEYTAAEP